jgi:hypothetical protein
MAKVAERNNPDSRELCLRTAEFAEWFWFLWVVKTFSQRRWVGLELRPRDLNPDYLVQSEACCHYTRAQSCA